MRTYGAPARMMASSGSDNPNWPTQNTDSQEGEYLTIARMLASSGPDQSNRPTQNTNYQEGKYLATARMTTSSSQINLRTSNNPAISNLLSAFSTGISGQSTIARNAGSFLLSAATTSLGGNSTLPPKILAQSDKFSDQRICPLPSQTLIQSNDGPDPLSKITEASAQSLFVTPAGNVPSNKMVPRLSREIQGSADVAPVAEPNAQTQTFPLRLSTPSPSTRASRDIAAGIRLALALSKITNRRCLLLSNLNAMPLRHVLEALSCGLQLML